MNCPAGKHALGDSADWLQSSHAAASYIADTSGAAYGVNNTGQANALRVRLVCADITP